MIRYYARNEMLKAQTLEVRNLGVAAKFRD